jgi:hypothetical protein
MEVLTVGMRLLFVRWVTLSVWVKYLRLAKGWMGEWLGKVRLLAHLTAWMVDVLSAIVEPIAPYLLPPSVLMVLVVSVTLVV